MGSWPGMVRVAGRKARRLVCAQALAWAILGAAGALYAQTTTPSAPPKQTAAEISSRDVAPTFKLKAERNLVLVRVVVHDAKGNAVDNLRQEDFRLFDRGKLQSILHFSIERPAQTAPGRSGEGGATSGAGKASEGTGETATAAIPGRFVALYFDDVSAEFGPLAQARNAALRLLAGAIPPSERVALYTASGQNQVDFTADVAKVREALNDLRPRPVAMHGIRTVITPYEAYAIVELEDPNLINLATEEILNTEFNGDPRFLAEARAQVKPEAQQEETNAEFESATVLRGVELLVRRMTSLPGQRTVIIISPGFFTASMKFDLGQIADRALHANVVLNAVDARGLYTDPTFDASQKIVAQTNNSALLAQKSTLLMQEAHIQTEGMASLALDTGGVFFANNNDLEAGLRRAGAMPEVYYLLAFSPQNMKFDGAFHPLQVKLASLKGLSIQARRGYFDPKKPTDPTQQEKEEIQEAVFSQDEVHEIPIDVHTQFFMKAEAEARIAVMTRIDLGALHFRREEDRNRDDVTLVTALFDQDGHLVNGQQKLLELHLRDISLEKYRQSGITLRTSFDAKPGTYLVRSVVRDSGSGQISSMNRTLEIPY